MTLARSLRIALAVSVLAAGGIVASLAHGDDPPATASFATVDVVHKFQLTAGSGAGSSASVVTGGTVTFTNDSNEPHDVDFVAEPGLACTQTSGGTSPSATAFPNGPTAGMWSGTCTFTKAGTYSFFCDQHPGMTGTVVVTDAGAGGTPPVATAPGTTTATTPVATTPVTTVPTTAQPVTVVPSPTPPAAVAQGTPQAPARALALTIAQKQSGTRIRGRLAGAQPAGTVRIALRARVQGARQVAVGTLRATAGAAGTLTFSVPLNAAAKRVLRQRSLTVTARITLPDATGTTVVRTARITVRKR
jgi:plastocyanin